MTYARVPDGYEDSLLNEIRAMRLRSSIILFPVALVLFGGLAVGSIFLRAHWLVEELRRLLGSQLSERSFYLSLVCLLLGAVGVGLCFVFRWMCKDCSIEAHLCCSRCLAVDSDDTGFCPVCAQPLSEKAPFFSTTYDDEKRLLEKHGYVLYREAS